MEYLFFYLENKNVSSWEFYLAKDWPEMREKLKSITCALEIFEIVFDRSSRLC